MSFERLESFLVVCVVCLKMKEEKKRMSDGEEEEELVTF
jgi:hypothetical protein